MGTIDLMPSELKAKINFQHMRSEAKTMGPIIKHIQQFQNLSLRVEGIEDDKLFDIFIETLKDNIQHEVRLFEPTSLEKDFMVGRKV